jgi:hypothetical protein
MEESPETEVLRSVRTVISVGFGYDLNSKIPIIAHFPQFPPFPKHLSSSKNPII